MKKIISFVGGLAIAAAAGSAHAAAVTSNAGLTFTSGGTCTVVGNVVNLGNFSATDTVATYALKFGSTSSPSVSPTASPVTLTTVNCTNTMSYSLIIEGTQSGKVARVKRSGAVVTDIFDVVPQVTQIGSSSIPKQYIHGDTTQNTYYGVGTGSDQMFMGYWAAFNPSATQLATVLEVGSYSAEAVATVNF